MVAPTACRGRARCRRNRVVSPAGRCGRSSSRGRLDRRPCRRSRPRSWTVGPARSPRSGASPTMKRSPAITAASRGRPPRTRWPRPSPSRPRPRPGTGERRAGGGRGRARVAGEAVSEARRGTDGPGRRRRPADRRCPRPRPSAAVRGRWTSSPSSPRLGTKGPRAAAPSSSRVSAMTVALAAGHHRRSHRGGSRRPPPLTIPCARFAAQGKIHGHVPGPASPAGGNISSTCCSPVGVGLLSSAAAAAGPCRARSGG